MCVMFVLIQVRILLNTIAAIIEKLISNFNGHWATTSWPLSIFLVIIPDITNATLNSVADY